MFHPFAMIDSAFSNDAALVSLAPLNSLIPTEEWCYEQFSIPVHPSFLLNLDNLIDTTNTISNTAK